MIALYNFLKIPVSHKLIILRFLFYIILIEAFYILFPYSITRKLVFKSPRVRLASPENALQTVKLHLRLLHAVCSRLPWKPTCIRLALILRRSLARKGIKAVIKIGVRQGRDRLEAHAWLECCGLELLRNGCFSLLASIG